MQDEPITARRSAQTLRDVRVGLPYDCPMDRERVPTVRFVEKYLKSGDLRFQDFMELALYHPEYGYYARARSPIGTEGDYVSNPSISPAFAYAIGKLIGEFLGHAGDALSVIVDVGCGDGMLIHDAALAVPLPERAKAAFFGIDRALARVSEVARNGPVTFVDDFALLPRGQPTLLLSNELFDAIPYSRLVRRGDELHEIWVTEREERTLDWVEREAPAPFVDYFAANGVELAEGQFADISLEWEPMYRDLALSFERGLMVTFDYGFPAAQLFDRRIRRFGTAAAYRSQRVSRDLLANAGEQDLTAHINFSDLIRAGNEAGLETLFFDRQANFLLGVGITGHELFKPADEVETASLAHAVDLIDARDAARRLILPDGIGEDIRVLVQSRGLPASGWSFQRKLY
jgi:SAM-dependent MidA family methyltransferase